MKCPYCNYINGYNNKKEEDVEGEKGKFFRLSNNIKMERDEYYEKDTFNLIGCPNCNKIFLCS